MQTHKLLRFGIWTNKIMVNQQKLIIHTGSYSICPKLLSNTRCSLAKNGLSKNSTYSNAYISFDFTSSNCFLKKKNKYLINYMQQHNMPLPGGLKHSIYRSPRYIHKLNLFKIYVYRWYFIIVSYIHRAVKR